MDSTYAVVTVQCFIAESVTIYSNFSYIWVFSFTLSLHQKKKTSGRTRYVHGINLFLYVDMIKNINHHLITLSHIQIKQFNCHKWTRPAFNPVNLGEQSFENGASKTVSLWCWHLLSTLLLFQWGYFSF